MKYTFGIRNLKIMALTLEQTNAARAAIGAPLLDKLPDTPDTTNKDDKPELNEDGTPKDKIEKKDETPAPVELTDDQLLEILNKRNIPVKSLDDLKKKDPEKTPEQIREEKENAKLSFGLTKGLFNKKDYENFVTDSNSKESVVFSQYHAEAKADDPTLTEDEIVSEFREKFGLDSEPGSRKHKRGAKEIEVIAKELLTSKYSKIYDADKKFSDHEQELSQAETYRANILAKTPEYQKSVNEAAAALKKIHDVEIPEAAINELRDRFLKQDFVERQINDGFTTEQVTNQFRAAIVTKNLPYILEKNAEQALLNKAAGVRGIVAPGEKAKETKPVRELTPAQQKQYDEYLASVTPKQKAEQN
jgi:hypothetical protein